MAWRDELLKLLAVGVRDEAGEPLEPDRTLRIIDAIASDPQLASALDELDGAAFRRVFLRLYRDHVGER